MRFTLSGFRFRVWGLGLGVSGSRFRDFGFGRRVWGCGVFVVRVSDFGFRILDFRFRVGILGVRGSGPGSWGSYLPEQNTGVRKTLVPFVDPS